MQDFKIQNIVGSCDVKFPIRLEGLAYAHGHFSSVSPCCIPGLISYFVLHQLKQFLEPPAIQKQIVWGLLIFSLNMVLVGRCQGWLC